MLASLPQDRLTGGLEYSGSHAADATFAVHQFHSLADRRTAVIEVFCHRRARSRCTHLSSAVLEPRAVCAMDRQKKAATGVVAREGPVEN